MRDHLDPVLGAAPLPHPPVIYAPAGAGGGDPDCAHEWVEETRDPQPHGDDGVSSSGLQGGKATQAATRIGAVTSRTCARCGAWEGQLGQEPTLEQFIEHVVAIFREVWRVLRPDGILWLNCGDSYAGSGCGPTTETSTLRGTRTQRIARRGAIWQNKSKVVTSGSFKPKDLMLIPQRLAIALQAAGWWVRSAPPWVKANPQPDSAGDRPGYAHEDWYMLTKSARYFWDHERVRVPQTGNAHSRGNGLTPKGAHADRGNNRANNSFHAATARYVEVPGGRYRRTYDWFVESLDHAIQEAAAYLDHLIQVREEGGLLLDPDGDPIALLAATRGTSYQHFATFPPHLVAPMLKASTPAAGCCPQCGAPWARVVARETAPTPASYRGSSFTKGKTAQHQPGAGEAARIAATATLGHRPTCACYRTRNPRKRRRQDRMERAVRRVERAMDEAARAGADYEPPAWYADLAPSLWSSRVRRSVSAPRRPAWVLDPFCGTGTVMEAALELGLHSAGVDLGFSYLRDMAADRIACTRARLAEAAGVVEVLVEVDGAVRRVEARQLAMF
ncbi:MAG: site-specific DNA-methyltransferase [Anaerolineae bacterium]|nr:site-specific DNA-methyltransferase [Anaerolineae bacterium]